MGILSRLWSVCTTPLWHPLLGAVVLSILVSAQYCHGFPRGGEIAAKASAHASSQYLASGWEAFQHGDLEHAAANWQEAVRLSAATQQTHAQSVALVHLAHAYTALGDYDQATDRLRLALRLAEEAKDQLQIPLILSHLGYNAAVTGNLLEAERQIGTALALATDLDNAELTASLLHTRGNISMAQQEFSAALQVYRTSATFAQQAGQPGMVGRALAHAALAAEHSKQFQVAQTLLEEALSALLQAASSHDTAYELLLIGRLYHRLADESPSLILRAAEVLQAAAHLAQTLKDARALSYAWGYLGRLYEEEGRSQEALELTRRAALAAQQINALESLYLWQWQTGRLLRVLGELEPAIAAYEHAIAVIQEIRPALLRQFRSGDPAVQGTLGPRSRGVRVVQRKARTDLSFREALGPLYFELADLFLQHAAALEKEGQETRDSHYAVLLQKARVTVEQFKTAELRDYFGDVCVAAISPHTAALERVAPHVAIVYPILLVARTELLVSLPSGLKRITVPIPGPALEQQVQSFRDAVEAQDPQRYLQHAQELYNWLLRPLEADLTAGHIGTIVFAPDGALRLMPLAALHDGQQFLVQKYALAITPSLTLTAPQPLPQQNLQVLAAGVAQAVEGFPALPFVQAELRTVQQLYKSVLLLDQDFNPERFAQTLQQGDFQIVHIASHSHFAPDTAQSFLLTAQGKLTFERLAQMIGRLRFRQQPLELLTLSACETARGDDRAALGLAGVAIQAGARSALASLWLIDDDATAELMKTFYQQLRTPGVSRAQALQQAQLTLLQQPQYAQPFFWAAFVLINNWL